CGGDVMVTYADGATTGDCTQTFTRTWTATDACGNSSSCDQVITLIDTIAPELVMPEQTSIHITCMAVDYAMLLDYVDGNLSNTQMTVYENFLAGIFMQNGLIPNEAIDNCNDASFFETGIEISTDVDCPAKATVKCVFVAEDVCGNVSDSEYAELVVIDNTTPHIFCPADIVVTCGSDMGPDVTGYATATDNCVGDIAIDFEDLYVSDFCPTSFVRLWTATDECGNIATCEQLITTVEEGDCVSTPTGLEAESVGPNSVEFTWDPVPNSVACRVFGRPAGGNGNLTLATVMGAEPSSATFTSGQLQDGLNIEWRVICACELSPLMTTPYSSWVPFTFSANDNKSFSGTDDNLVEGKALKGELYPNPTRSSVFINSVFNEDETLTVMDLSGKVIAQYNVTVGSGLFEINMEELESGVYFIQHLGLNGQSQTFKVVKNN
ncbi:MAG: T9SS type A sorting domain-containing protein, partial [Bacteroidota bacterium]